MRIGMIALVSSCRTTTVLLVPKSMPTTPVLISFFGSRCTNFPFSEISTFSVHPNKSQCPRLISYNRSSSYDSKRHLRLSQSNSSLMSLKVFFHCDTFCSVFSFVFDSCSVVLSGASLGNASSSCFSSNGAAVSDTVSIMIVSADSASGISSSKTVKSAVSSTVSSSGSASHIGDALCVSHCCVSSSSLSSDVVESCRTAILPSEALS